MDPNVRRTGTTEFHRRAARTATEPGLGIPRRDAKPPERGARRLVVGSALLLLALAGWTAWSARPTPSLAPVWSTLAPPREVAMRTWRWLVFRSGGRDGAHLAVAASPNGDPARVELLPGWTLQWPAPGYPADAIVVAVGSPVGEPQVETRLVELAATLLTQLPTLSIQRIGADRSLPPPGLDQDRLRFRIRSLVAATGSAR
jgi:hypothetical protein